MTFVFLVTLYLIVKPMIAVIDYGAGNLRSVSNALAVLGAEFFVTKEPPGLEQASAIILPGVGHFGQMMEALEADRLAAPLRQRLESGTPYLGICLGMQALFESSEEAPGLRGLALLPGRVRRFPSGQKVPHMGWAEVEPGGAKAGAFLAQAFLAQTCGRMYYFAHSYYVPGDAEGCAAVARHGLPFTAVLRRANLVGTQFHPEKSGSAGLNFLRTWVEQCQPSASSPAST